MSITIKNINKKMDTKLSIDMFSARGVSIKNSPSYIRIKSIISIKLMLYCTLMLVSDLKPHS